MTADPRIADARVADAARRLLEARRTATRIDVLTHDWPDLTLDTAQAIAFETVTRAGSPCIGYKLGYTSEAMRRQMRISAPNFGWLTAEADFSKGCPAGLVHPRIEPEVTLVTGKDLGGDPVTRAAVAAAVASVHASLEIVDTRYRDYNFTAADNTADNSSSAGFVLGPPCAPALLAEPLAVILENEDGVLERGSSTAALGGPIEALVWLAEALRRRGDALPAGSLIMTGGLTAAPRLVPGRPVRATFEELGTVGFTWG